MKPAEILRQALERLGPDGEWWWRGKGQCTGDYCAITALRHTESTMLVYNKAVGYLHEATHRSDVVDWNDNAESFDVIRAGFERAIALAEKEER